MCVYRQRVRIHSFCTQQPKQPNKIEYDWHEDGFHLTSFYSVFVIRHSAFNIHSHHSHAKSIKFHWIQTSWMDCFNLLEKKYIFSSFILSFDEIFRYTRFVQNFLCIDICRFFFFFFLHIRLPKFDWICLVFTVMSAKSRVKTHLNIDFLFISTTDSFTINCPVAFVCSTVNFLVLGMLSTFVRRRRKNEWMHKYAAKYNECVNE